MDMTTLQRLSLASFWNVTKSNSMSQDKTTKERFPFLNTELGKASVLHELQPSQLTATDEVQGQTLRAQQLFIFNQARH